MEVTMESYDEASGIASMKVIAPGFYMSVHHIDVEYQEQDSKETQTAQLALEEGAHRTYVGTIDLSGWETPDGEIRINVYMEDGSKYENIVSYSVSDLKNAMDSEESD